MWYVQYILHRGAAPCRRSGIRRAPGATAGLNTHCRGTARPQARQGPHAGPSPQAPPPQPHCVHPIPRPTPSSPTPHPPAAAPRASSAWRPCRPQRQSRRSGAPHAAARLAPAGAGGWGGGVRRRAGGGEWRAGGAAAAGGLKHTHTHTHSTWSAAPPLRPCARNRASSSSLASSSSSSAAGWRQEDRDRGAGAGGGGWGWREQGGTHLQHSPCLTLPTFLPCKVSSRPQPDTPSRPSCLQPSCQAPHPAIPG